MTLKHEIARLRAVAAAVLAAAMILACGPRPDPVVEITGPTMGTYYAVKIARPPAGLDADKLRAGIDGVLDQVIAEISTYDPDSELSRLNAAQNDQWVPVSAPVISAVQEGRRIGTLSGGAFDITIGPLVDLWGFGPKAGSDEPPAPAAIAAALQRVGPDKIELREDPPAIRKARPDVRIDLSALGEGYGVDRVAAYLESLGISDYMVAVAGTLRVSGMNARRAPWGIAIERPEPGERTAQRVLPLTDKVISTSGDYRNFFESKGRRYSHHIDPTTGESVAHRLASVTVVMDAAEGAMRADALATALIVIGEEKAQALAEAEDIPAFFIIRDDDGFTEISSSALERMTAP